MLCEVMMALLRAVLPADPEAVKEEEDAPDEEEAGERPGEAAEEAKASGRKRKRAPRSRFA